MKKNVDHMMTCITAFKKEPSHGMQNHGYGNVVSNKMSGKQAFQIKALYQLVFKNHFRIIPADMAKKQKFGIQREGHNKPEANCKMVGKYSS